MDQQVASLLLNTLSAQAATRISAEIQLEELHNSGDAAVCLARIALAQDADLSLRQSASINLKKYVREHWSAALEHFKGNPPHPEIKSQIRQAVFVGLSDSIRKIRLACASIVSEIASSDWPDEWPDLLDSLVQLLKSGQPDSVHGAMRVMTDFVSADLSEDQLLPLSSTLLPELLRILGDERYSHNTRADSIAVFNQCVSTLYMVKENHPQIAQYATDHVLPVWTQTFRHILSSDPVSNGNADSLYVRNEIFQTLNTILISFPKVLSQHTEAFLLDAARHLTILAQPFRAACLNDNLEETFDLSSDDGVNLTLPVVLSNIMLYIANASRKTSGRSALVNKTSNEPSEILQQIVYLAVYLGQISTEDEERWTSDMNAFVSDEDDEMPSSTLRTSSLDLVNSFFNSFAEPTVRTLTSAVDRITQESSKLQSEEQEDWWKGYESALNHLASAAEELTEHTKDSSDKSRPQFFDLEKAFGSLVMPFLSRPDLPFLQGRALIFASRFATLLPEHLQQQFFQSSLQAFESSDTSFVLKVCALRALKNFCAEIPDSPIFASFGDRIATNLLSLVPQGRDATLVLIIETLQRILSFGTLQQSPQFCEAFSSTLLEPISNESLKDPVLQTTLCDLWRTFASNEREPVYNSLKQVALPKLAQLLSQDLSSDSGEQQVSSAIIILNAILDGRPKGLGADIFPQFAQALFTVLARTDDDSVIQEGLECLTYVVRKDYEQLGNWSGPDGQTGLGALFGIISQVLHPDRSESASLFIGDLLLHVFRCARDAVLPILPDLLQALLVRLTTAQTSTFSQSLILPFAYLMHSQTDTVLDLLHSVNIDGKSGTEILLPAWTDNAELFLGFWNNRVSTYALTKLVLSRHPSLDKIEVKGDLIVDSDSSGVIMTRSRAKKAPPRFTQIPVRVKALKLILKEIEQSTEPSAEEEVDNAEEDGTEEWEDDDAADVPKGAIDLFSFVKGGGDLLDGDDDDDEDDTDDEDLKSDAVYSMDMPHHLSDTVRTLANQERAFLEASVQFLTPAELHTLHSI